MDAVIRVENLTHTYSVGTPFEKTAINNINVEGFVKANNGSCENGHFLKAIDTIGLMQSLVDILKIINDL